MAEKITLNQETVQKLLNNSVLLQRQKLAESLGKAFDNERDYYKIFGYKKSLTYTDYYNKYDRQDMAGRIVEAAPDETWRQKPELIEDEKTSTKFEEEWESLVNKIKVYHYCKRADKLSRIGQFGVLLIGVKDTSKLSQEMPKLNDINDIVYLSSYGQGRVDIDSSDWETDVFSSRYGMPKYYRIDLQGNIMGGDESTKTKVHHSRVIHIAENLEEDDVYSRPVLKRVFNLLDDLYKVAGGAPEMFWQNARKGLQANLMEGYDADTQDLGDIQDELDEYYNGLRRYVRTQGMELKDLGVAVADPSSTFKVIIQLISAATGIPARILLGSERGELASSEDEKNWLSQIETRQINFAEPIILRPLVDRLIKYGALPAVEYEVKWPDLFKLDDAEKATMYLNKAKAANEFAIGAASSIVDIEKILRDELGLPIVEMEEEPLDEEDEDVREGFETMKED